MLSVGRKDTADTRNGREALVLPKAGASYHKREETTVKLLILGGFIVMFGIAVRIVAITNSHWLTASYVAMLIGLAVIYKALRDNQQS
ncbi:MAG: hypothetical protein WC243_00605 [Patescibacteria group bacterium]